MKGELLERITERSKAARVPLEVLWEITHRCNLPCTHCHLPDHLNHGELSFEEVCGVLDQLAQAGTVFLTLTGGEVLSRSDFLEILDAAAARGFAVKVLTNATLVTDEVADRFARAGVLEVSVSVYAADPAVHDRVTEMPGSYHRTMAGIARLKARGIHVLMKTPVLTLNGELVHDLHRLAQLQNIPCSFNLVITSKHNGDPAPLELALHRQSMVRLMTDEALGPKLLPTERESGGPEPCNAGRGYCAIGPTGDLMPCITMPVVLGNLRQRSFAELWYDDPFLAKLRSITADDLTTCQSCELKRTCSRCPGQAMKRGQGVDGCDPSAKQIAKARVEARMRLRVVQ